MIDDFRLLTPFSFSIQSQQEGTALYRSLEKKAKLKFLSSAPDRTMSTLPKPLQKQLSLDENTSNPYFDVQVDEILSSTEPLTEKTPVKLFDDSPLDWLIVSPEEVDAILKARMQADAEVSKEAVGKQSAKKSSSQVRAHKKKKKKKKQTKNKKQKTKNKKTTKQRGESSLR